MPREGTTREGDGTSAKQGDEQAGIHVLTDRGWREKQAGIRSHISRGPKLSTSRRIVNMNRHKESCDGDYTCDVLETVRGAFGFL